MTETIEEACKRYIAVLNSPANANGGHGANGLPSHRILGSLYGQFGEAEVKNMLRLLFAKVS